MHTILSHIFWILKWSGIDVNKWKDAYYFVAHFLGLKFVKDKKQLSLNTSRSLLLIIPQAVLGEGTSII